MKELSVSVVGCGRIAWQLEHDALRYKPCTHLGALKYWQQRDQSLRISALCDLAPARARAAAQFMQASGNRAPRSSVDSRPAPLITEHYSEALRQKPDLLVVAANTAAHFEILAAALQAKIPRIVAEKPVAFSAREAKKLRELLNRGESIIVPNYERRYHTKYLALKDKISREPNSPSYRAFFAAGSSTGGARASGGQACAEPGRSEALLSVGGSPLYANNKNGDEGVLLHDTTHLLDLAQFLFGRIRRFEAVRGERKHLLYLLHTNGSEGVIETSLGIGVFHLELEIHLKKERVIVGNGFQATESIEASRHYKHLRSYGLPMRQADKKFPPAKNPFVQLYRYLLYGQPDNSHFLEALENVEIVSHP